MKASRFFLETIRFHNLFSRLREKFGDRSAGVVVVLVIGATLICLGLMIPSVRSLLTRSIPIRVITIIVGVVYFVLLGIIAALISVRPKIRRVEFESATDGVLGCYNHRECIKNLEKGISEVDRYGTVFSVCLMDLDGLKKMNDEYGYPAGDNLLKEFVLLVQSSVRGTDTLFRYKQGDEFLILARNTAVEEAIVLCERIRATTERYRFQSLKDRADPHITVSIGIAELSQNIGQNETVEMLIKKVEKALSDAKKSKNAVKIYDG